MPWLEIWQVKTISLSWSTIFQYLPFYLEVSKSILSEVQKDAITHIRNGLANFLNKTADMLHFLTLPEKCFLHSYSSWQHSAHYIKHGWSRQELDNSYRGHGATSSDRKMAEAIRGSGFNTIRQPANYEPHGRFVEILSKWLVLDIHSRHENFILSICECISEIFHLNMGYAYELVIFTWEMAHSRKQFRTGNTCELSPLCIFTLFASARYNSCNSVLACCTVKGFPSLPS